MTRVGYWPDAAEAAPLDDGPVVIASQDYAQAVDSALGDRYVSEFYGLRPGVLLDALHRAHALGAASGVAPACQVSATGFWPGT